MEDLYTGLTGWKEFRVRGFAMAFDGKAWMKLPRSRLAPVGDIAASFGLGYLRVEQLGSRYYSPDPSFNFRQLTTRFLATAIQNDPTSKFSLIQKRIGEVAYVSGAGARDYGGNISQGIISLQAVGNWNPKGLKLSMKGSLGEVSEFIEWGTVTRANYKHSSYYVELDIPWLVLRFLFFDQVNFVASNYCKYAAGSESASS